MIHKHMVHQWRTQIFFFGGGGGGGVLSGIFFVGGEVQQIHLRTEGRENGELGAVAP
jgi:hypothetical protein